MQHLNWDDLRIFIALSRSESYNDAARILGVDGTTVSRRIKAFEQLLGTQLIMRVGVSGFQLTEAGIEVARSAQNTEREMESLQARVSDADIDVKGRVVLTSVPMVINRILIPTVQFFAAQNLNLEIHLVPDNRNLSLTNREADMALRLGRPKEGGHQIKARRIGTLAHAIYVVTTCQDGNAADLPWVTYQESMSHVSHAQWIKKEVRQAGGHTANVRVGEYEGAIEAVAQDCGKTILPCLVGDVDPRLRRFDYPNATPMLEREVWLLVHSDTLYLARIRAVVGWLEGVFVNPDISN